MSCIQDERGFQRPDPPPGSGAQTRVTRLESGHCQPPWLPRPAPHLAARPQVSGQRWGARLSRRRRAWPAEATGSTQPAGLQGAGRTAVRVALDPAPRYRADPPTNPRMPRWVPSCPLASPWPHSHLGFFFQAASKASRQLARSATRALRRLSVLGCSLWVGTQAVGPHCVQKLWEGAGTRAALPRMVNGLPLSCWACWPKGRI